MIAIVIVELALDREFDYTIPAGMPVKVGMLVEVPFGHQTKRGYVVGLKETSTFKKLKGVLMEPVRRGSLLRVEVSDQYKATNFEKWVVMATTSVMGGSQAFLANLCVGLGGGWEIHVSSVAAAPWLGPQKGGFSGQRFFHHWVLEKRSRRTTTAVLLVFAVRAFFVLMKNIKINVLFGKMD